MASDFGYVRVSEDITLRRFPSLLYGQVAGGEVFTPGEPLTLDGSKRFIRPATNPSDVVGIARQGAAGVIAGTGMAAYQLGDGTIWRWATSKFARDGAGTLVAPAQTDFGVQAGLSLVGSEWRLDTGVSNKVAEVVGILGARVDFRFLRNRPAQLVASGSILFSSGLASFVEITPGDVVMTGAFGGVRNRLNQIGDVAGAASFTPDTANFNAFRFRPTGNMTINNPSTEPANDETMILTFHIVSDGTARTVTVGSKFKLVGGGTTFTSSAVATEEQILSCSWNGTNWRSVLSLATAA